MPLIAMAGMTLAANFAEDDTWLLFELTIDHCPDRYPVSDKEVVALIDLFEEGPINKDSSWDSAEYLHFPALPSESDEEL